MEEKILSESTITETTTDTAETCAKIDSDTNVGTVTTNADSDKPAKKKSKSRKKTNAPETPSLDTLTNEISMYIDAGNFNLSQAAKSYMEAGKRLIQAKALVGHGNWAKWLDENFSLSQATAENYMKLAKRFPDNPETFRNLSPSKMIAMLALPTGDEQNFIDEQKAAGNDIVKMPTRKLSKAVKDYNRKSKPAPADVTPSLKIQQELFTDTAPVEVSNTDTQTEQVTIDTQATITGANSPVDVSDFVNIKIPADTYSKLVKLADKLSAPADVILVETLNQLFIKYEDELKD